MARDEKRVELRTVDDAADEPTPVIRLESSETLHRQKPVRLVPTEHDSVPNHRLELPDREEFDARTHQPGIEALAEQEAADPHFAEKEWGAQASEYRIPWGWFVLIGLAIIIAVLWSLSGSEKSGTKVEDLRASSASVVVKDAAEDLEAGQLISNIEGTILRYFAASTVEELMREVRQPERVEPLIRAYYGDRLLPPNRWLKTNLLQPLTLENHANFWMATVQLADHTSRNLILEILAGDQPRVDWETLVCYQPMKWDAYAKERPAGTSLDFRVYVEPDNFYSHEFANSDVWNCFRLTAANSDETLFGYAKVGGPVAAKIQEIQSHSLRSRASLILRLTVPEGLKSRRGVVIEEVESPRWLYVEPPEG